MNDPQVPVRTTYDDVNTGDDVNAESEYDTGYNVTVSSTKLTTGVARNVKVSRIRANLKDPSNKTETKTIEHGLSDLELSIQTARPHSGDHTSDINSHGWYKFRLGNLRISFSSHKSKI